ncbi:MAG: LmeA family phospholipid-binding protein, partial [Symploca sp. SIO1B1]|nr:LmeA family phospholipid-binding protein [Symploca sp. SIO1B1]
MELFTILFSGLISFISPLNSVGDIVIENALRSRLEKVEQLDVRIDNAPNHQIAKGKLQRLRI